MDSGDGRVTGAAGSPRVLVLTPYSLNTNPYIRLLVGALEAHGVDVRLATGRSPVLLWKALRKDGVPHVVHVQWHHRYFTSDTLSGAVLRTLLFFTQWLTLRLLGTKFVWTVHNLLDHERSQPRWELFVCRRWARRVDALIVHCKEAVELVADAYRVPTDRIHVVSHGHFPEVQSPLDRAEARDSLDLPDSARILLFFGRIRPYKGLEKLLDAFEAIEREDVRLLLVGFPDSEAYGRRLAARAAQDPRVTVDFRFVSPTRLDTYLAAADVAVLPYTDLLTSGAAILAASRDRPVVAPALACLRDLPPDTALLYSPEDEDGLADGIRRALQAPLDRMGRKAREHADRFPWTRVAAETTAVYRTVRS